MDLKPLFVSVNHIGSSGTPVEVPRLVAVS